MPLKRIPIPKTIHEIFEKELRIDIGPIAGIWAINIKDLMKAGMLDKLAADKDLAEHYQIIIAPKK